MLLPDASKRGGERKGLVRLLTPLFPDIAKKKRKKGFGAMCVAVWVSALVVTAITTAAAYVPVACINANCTSTSQVADLPTHLRTYVLLLVLTSRARVLNMPPVVRQGILHTKVSLVVRLVMTRGSGARIKKGWKQLIQRGRKYDLFLLFDRTRGLW